MEAIVNIVCLSSLQLVTETQLAKVAWNVITHVRFALLDPQTLSEVEEENTRNNFVPVSGPQSVGAMLIDGFSVQK